MAAKVSKTENQQESFEQRLEQLEAIAEKMEHGNLPLQELMKEYEAGTLLSKGLQEELAKAKARMMEIKQGKGQDITLASSEVAQQSSLLDDFLEIEE